ncbi:zinc finger FYVE domain-containing protein 21-like [Oscarella lobularis]|uniref:zinc finger FYVE domain-containing protein 21-like n=1 Tax=Oscarella lobularis TaxID=121494 RepID=UPI003313D7F2
MAKRLVQSKGGLKMVPMDGKGSIFDIPEPKWKHDSTTPMCSNPSCGTQFDFFHRRHHCRICGKVYCDSCSDYRQPVLRMGLVDSVRLCKTCEGKAKKGNHFVSHELKSLVKGAHFSLSEVEGLTFRCHLSDDHREIMFDGGTDSTRDPIMLRKIVEVKNADSKEASPDEKGSPQPGSEINGLILFYRDEGKERSIEIGLKHVSEDELKVSQNWLLFLKKALKTLHEK